MADAKYGRSLLPFGVFLKVGGLPYSTKGSEQIKVPGEIGTLQGATGITGFFMQNHFKRLYVLEEGGIIQGRDFEIDRKILSKISGGGTGSISSIPELESAPSGEIEASYDQVGSQFTKYFGLFLQVDDWIAVENEIKAKTPDEQRRLADDNVRIVEAVLYATGFEAGGGVTIASGIESDVLGVESVSFTAALNGGQTENVSLKLSGSNPIAYSYRMLCWKGVEFDRTVPDDIGSGRPSSCGTYK